MERPELAVQLRKLVSGRRLLLGSGLLGVAAVVLAVVLIFVTRSGGDGESAKAVAAATPTEAARAVSADGTATRPAASAGLLTPIPVASGATLTDQDLAARGAGVAGRGAFSGERLRIPSIGVDAPFSVHPVGDDGQMPNPNGPEDVAWYDFSAWDGLGGVPGRGGNVVLAGHVDYINYGPAVFWRLRELAPGDRVQILLNDGTVAEYAIEFSKTVPADEADWTPIVSATADESVTLITCVGQFSAGHYSDRQITWGRRVS